MRASLRAHARLYLCRAAASPLIKAAEKACRQQTKAEQAGAKLSTMEADYLDLYNLYQSLVAHFKGETAPQERSAQLQQELVQVMGELATKAKQLIHLKATS